MTDANRESALAIQNNARRIALYLNQALDDEGNVDIIRLSVVNVHLSEIVGLLILTGTWVNQPLELAKQIARLMAAQDQSNDLAKAVAKLDKVPPFS